MAPLVPRRGGGMVAKCSYTKRLWRQVEAWSNDQGLAITTNNIRDWWKKLSLRAGEGSNAVAKLE